VCALLSITTEISVTRHNKISYRVSTVYLGIFRHVICFLKAKVQSRDVTELFRNPHPLNAHFSLLKTLWM